MRDHAYGDMADDAFRRDFTINALYFDIQSGEIIDYIGGMEDVRQRRVRFIGNPEERLAEDPVRYLRAIRFSAKLGFEIDPGNSGVRPRTPPNGSRQFPAPGCLTSFRSCSYPGMAPRPGKFCGTPRWCAPCSPAAIRTAHWWRPPCRALIAVSQSSCRLPRGFLIAVLLWEDYQARSAEQNPDNKPAATFEIAMDVLAVQQQHIAVPRRFSIFAREVWQLQNRLEERHPRFVRRLLGHRRFRAAFDFLCLRGEEDDRLQKLGRWWEKIQESRQRRTAADDQRPGQVRTQATPPPSRGQSGHAYLIFRSEPAQVLNAEGSDTVQASACQPRDDRSRGTPDQHGCCTESHTPIHPPWKALSVSARPHWRRAWRQPSATHCCSNQPMRNPFLDRFYVEGSKHALPTQLFFLLHRTRLVEQIPSNDLLGPSLIADFLMEKDRLFARLTLDEAEFQLYQQIHDSLSLDPPKPDLVIYLQAPAETLYQRVPASRYRRRTPHRTGLPARAGGSIHRVLPLLRRGAAVDR